MGRPFSRDELREVAANLTDEIGFLRMGNLALSAAEVFGLLVNALGACIADPKSQAEVLCRAVYNPTARPAKAAGESSVPWTAFCDATRATMNYVNEKHEVPNGVECAGKTFAPGDFLAAVARVLGRALRGDSPPEKVEIRPAPCRFEDHVDEAAAKSGWKGSMMPAEFAAPRMVDLARLEAWTLKPAILKS
jgi:hypothetical protein